MSNKIYKKDELVSYCKSNKSKFIITIHGEIYDVTKFANDHPGGELALREFQVKDNIITDAGETFEDVGHSADARDIMKKYKIGTLKK